MINDRNLDEDEIMDADIPTHDDLHVGDEIVDLKLNRSYKLMTLTDTIFSAEPTDGSWAHWGGSRKMLIEGVTYARSILAGS